MFFVELHAFAFLSNHYHLLLSVDTALQLARFMNYLNSNLAREAGRIHGWSEKFWGRRYQAIIISDEEASQVDRLRYILSQGCKEGLVARPRDWPGAHCVRALVEGKTLRGLWFDRTREYAVRVRRKAYHHLDYATSETVRLQPLPCWKHLTQRDCTGRAAELTAAIEADTARHHAISGTRPLGVKALRAQQPHNRPDRPKRTRAPAFHAATSHARKELVEAYSSFVTAYREAAQRLREGNSRASFPEGSFPPRPPFIDWIPDFAPG
jgi:hypothetical protein